MSDSEMLEPDQAVQRWRDQIEENNRLRHHIADCDARIEELARLNHQALFEANRYQSLYSIEADRRDYAERRVAMLEGQIKAIALVSEQASQALRQVAYATIEAATAEPPPAPPREPPPAAHSPISDDPIEPPPAFVSKPHATPLPEAVGL